MAPGRRRDIPTIMPPLHTHPSPATPSIECALRPNIFGILKCVSVFCANFIFVNLVGDFTRQKQYRVFSWSYYDFPKSRFFCNAEPSVYFSILWISIWFYKARYCFTLICFGFVISMLDFAKRNNFGYLYCWIPEEPHWGDPRNLAWEPKEPGVAGFPSFLLKTTSKNRGRIFLKETKPSVVDNSHPLLYLGHDQNPSSPSKDS